jgi:CDP-diglyceride synthetase
MGPLEHVIHTFNFMAPAWWMALFCALFARFALRSWLSASRLSVLAQTFWGGLLGSLTLLGCLWVWGADGKMATYGALVLVCATSQWLMCQGWRR